MVTRPERICRWSWLRLHSGMCRARNTSSRRPESSGDTTNSLVSDMSSVSGGPWPQKLSAISPQQSARAKDSGRATRRICTSDLSDLARLLRGRVSGAGSGCLPLLAYTGWHFPGLRQHVSQRVEDALPRSKLYVEFALQTIRGVCACGHGNKEISRRVAATHGILYKEFVVP